MLAPLFDMVERAMERKTRKKPQVTVKNREEMPETGELIEKGA
jgi:hypothetical protein